MLLFIYVLSDTSCDVDVHDIIFLQSLPNEQHTVIQ